MLYNIAAKVDHKWSDQRVHASASVIATGRIYRGAKVIGQRAQKWLVRGRMLYKGRKSDWLEGAYIGPQKWLVIL